VRRWDTPQIRGLACSTKGPESPSTGGVPMRPPAPWCPARFPSDLPPGRTPRRSRPAPGVSGDSQPGKEGVLSGNTSKRCPSELKEPPMRMVAEVDSDDHKSEWAGRR